ncbi:DUF317 domain-containing protein [Streptomyces sp. NPDC001262]|uniref:DUF317 domain-containing protein n=1 Tax=Streptomyces sp. NPDC001262 TaxID=3364552 RepID=UPI0036B65E00
MHISRRSPAGERRPGFQEPPLPPSVREDPFQEYLVSPRHLAGSTAIGDPGLQPLRDLGWALHHDDLGNTYLSAPDHRIRLGYLPEGDDDGLWRISAYHDAFGSVRWAATFNDRTPTEFVTAFTTALAQAYTQGPDAYLHGATNEPDRAFTPMTAAGWQHHRRAWTDELTAPDSLARLTYEHLAPDHQSEIAGHQSRWWLRGGTGRRFPDWYATFTTHTPTQLITATTTAIVDPTPVTRYTRELSRLTRNHAQLTPIPPPVPTPLDVRRAQAARARTATTQRRRTAAPRPATPSATPAAGRRVR